MASSELDSVSTNRIVEYPEDDSTQLLFPPVEFENSETLLISEVFMLLDHRRKTDIENGELDAAEIPEVFSKAYQYTDAFNKYKSIENISVARNVLAKSYAHLHPFEVAALANLCPSLADEAKKLIP
ncbi:hypothetical protein MXB_1642, partial [Myxobolus squamalis]